MLPFLFGVFVSFGLLVASPHMSKEEEAIVFAMKGMSEAGFVHKTLTNENMDSLAIDRPLFKRAA